MISCGISPSSFSGWRDFALGKISETERHKMTDENQKTEEKKHTRATKSGSVAIMEPLLVIGKVLIATAFNGGYVAFVSDLDVCTDGTGDDHGDDYHQNETAYYNGGEFLDADEDQYLVIPPQIRSDVPPVVMGCQGRVTNLKTGKWWPAVTG